ncbi:uncharacterized protein LOC143306261 [Osmia lignaria lignaria]|uniref:uncharacterized protein LOC143306261 n=1 Tax=Osmia lignaria lignaria TaxID=1437193 RepID=UPI00402B3555
MDVYFRPARGTLMESFIKPNNKNIKSQKNKTGQEQYTTTIGKKEDMIKPNDRKVRDDVYKVIVGEGTEKIERVKITDDIKLNKTNKVFDFKSAFRPTRTLSRSPTRKSGEITADVDLTGDEDENVFSDTSSAMGNMPKTDDSNKQKESETEKESKNVGGLNAALMAIDQILGMVKSSNDLVNNYLLKIAEGSSMVAQISSDMGVNLIKTRDLIKEAIISYKEEKSKQEEYTKREEKRTIQILESLDKIGKRQNILDTRNEITENLNKRKNVTPPEMEATIKRTRTTNKETRSKPMIRSIQIIKNSEGASSDSDWETVGTKRRKQPNEKIKNLNTGNNTTPYNDTNRKRSITTAVKRNEAIAISVNKEMTYAQATKKLKEKMGNNVEGVKRIRHTRTGDILIEFDRETDSTDFHNKVKSVMGEDAKVRRLVPKVTIEVLDIDPGADKDEIVECISISTGVEKDSIKCKNIRSSFAGTQTAIIEGPGGIGKLLIENRIKIGWVYCRVRLLPSIIRCFKCHNFGHLATRCAAVEGEAVVCRRCGENSHAMSECKAEKASCRLCAQKGIVGSELNHIAGSLRCRQYKEAISGAIRVNKIQS